MLTVGKTNSSTFQTHGILTHEPNIMNYVTPMTFEPPSTSSFLPTPSLNTEKDFFKPITSVKSSFPKILKSLVPNIKNNETYKLILDQPTKHILGNNITVFTPEDFNSPFKTIQPEPPLVTHTYTGTPHLSNSFKNPYASMTHDHNTHNSVNVIISDGKLHNIIEQEKHMDTPKKNSLNGHDALINQIFDNPFMRNNPTSQSGSIRLFTPNDESKKIPQTANKYVEMNELKNPTTTNIQAPSKKNYTFSAPYQIHESFKNLKDKQKSYIDRTAVTIMKNTRPKELNPDVWRKLPSNHVLLKEPNPYETVLLRAVPNPKIGMKSTYVPNTKNIPKIPNKSYSSLDLEHLLNQMEIQSEVNRNLGRSADKSHGTAAVGQ